LPLAKAEHLVLTAGLKFQSIHEQEPLLTTGSSKSIILIYNDNNVVVAIHNRNYL
jgi:hypothetical protein